MLQRGSIRTVAGAAGVLLVAFLLVPHKSSTRPRDYTALVDLLKTQQKEEAPLFTFNAFEDVFDRDARSLGLGLFSQHPKLMRKIRRDLGPGEIEWRLEHPRQRLLFVPERSEKLAGLFRDYCGHIVDYTLAKTRLENPYVDIVTPAEANPPIPASGVTVFLVHNLAEETKGTYIFSNTGRNSLRIDLSRKTFLGEIGSYSTNVFLQGPDRPEFTWNRYTIWQTTARNPFTVLTVPLEETLHIAVRENTHRAIREQFEANPAQGLEAIVEDWMAVEEALVGGVVHALLPRFLEECNTTLPGSFVEEDLASRTRFGQYRHLGRAIEVVEQLGYEEALRMYEDHPARFRDLVI